MFTVGDILASKNDRHDLFIMITSISSIMNCLAMENGQVTFAIALAYLEAHPKRLGGIDRARAAALVKQAYNRAAGLDEIGFE